MNLQDLIMFKNKLSAPFAENALSLDGIRIPGYISRPMIEFMRKFLYNEIVSFKIEDETGKLWFTPRGKGFKIIRPGDGSHMEDVELGMFIYRRKTEDYYYLPQNVATNQEELEIIFEQLSKLNS